MATLKIGLTGGIASGKSTVADMFKKLGVDVFDADIIAKQLVDNDETIQKQISSYFGTVDRKQLRNIIFRDPIKRAWLETLLHPKILQELEKLSHNSKSDYCVLVIPLLFEAKCESLVDYVLVVDSNETIQKKRLKQRDDIDDVLIKQMLNAQVSRVKRTEKADFVISNEKNLEHLFAEVQKLHDKFLEFCAVK